MSYTIAFIDKTALTERTDLPASYSETNVRNAILDAQNLDLYPIIGKKLYERFDTDIDNGDYSTEGSYATNNPKYVEVMENYMVPFLIWASYIRQLETVYITPRNNGLQQRSNPAGTTVDAAGYNLKVSQARTKLDFFSDKLSEYLRDNTSDFEELTESTDLLSDYPQYEQAKDKLVYFGGNSLKRKLRGYNL